MRQINAATPVLDQEGHYQRPLLECAKGKIAVFGESSFFTAQIAIKTLRWALTLMIFCKMPHLYSI